MSNIPSFSTPVRSIQMRNGEWWTFAFDNAALHCVEKQFIGAASSIEMMYALTSTHRRKGGIVVDFDTFMNDILPPMADPNMKAITESLMAEIASSSKGNAAPAQASSQTTQASAGNESGPSQQPNADGT